MSDLLKITTKKGKVMILHLEGTLDVRTETELVDAAREAFDSGTHNLLLDLGGLQMITSAGLRALRDIYNMYTPIEEIEAWTARHTGETFKSPYFKIAQPSSNIHYILSIAGFLQSIYIFPSLQKALDSFS